MARRRGKGERCSYCARVLEPSTSRGLLAATRDHYVPQSMWGEDTVWACLQCNALKADLSPEQWATFMLNNPEWWRRPEFKRRRSRVRACEIVPSQTVDGTATTATVDEQEICKDDSAAIAADTPESVIR